jgi:hypothetical protein
MVASATKFGRSLVPISAIPWEFAVKPVCLFAIAALIALPVSLRAEAERIPHLAVEKSCHDAETYGLTDRNQTYKNCMSDEDDAKQQLEQKWSTYKGSTRQSCLAAGAHPSPSYVELLTCIEMTEEILTPSGGGGGGGAGEGFHPGGPGSLGSPPPRPTLSPGPRAMPR